MRELVSLSETGHTDSRRAPLVLRVGVHSLHSVFLHLNSNGRASTVNAR